MLSAWKVTDESDPRFESCSTIDPKPVLSRTEVKLDAEVEHIKHEEEYSTRREETRPTGDQTIDLLDTSLDSIPETPEFAKKVVTTEPKKRYYFLLSYNYLLSPLS